MRISDWSSDVCSSDLRESARAQIVVAARMIVPPIIVSLEIDGQPVCRSKTETASDSAAVQIVDVVARDDVFAVAVTILCLKGDARGKQSRNDGAADRAFGDDLRLEEQTSELQSLM